MKKMFFDVAVIGGGPAGLAAALSADKTGANVVLIERESKLGGILKQCIHDGFGVVRFKEKLSGPEYAERFISQLKASNVTTMLSAFVSAVKKIDDIITLTLSTKQGIVILTVKSIVLATGCREKTSKQISLHGTRPSGVFTAGSAQYYTNILGWLPTKKCVILGSGDIGLIMARRLTLEGAQVLCVCEAQPQPGGLMRNVYQCLDDFEIPLKLSHTVTRVFGKERLEAVEVCRVDEKMQPIEGTSEIIECDALILSVGLIPENELAQSLGVEIQGATKGPMADQNAHTLKDGIFVCGNARAVNDLADYVSEGAELAGKKAGEYSKAKQNGRALVKVNAAQGILSMIPQILDINSLSKQTVFYIRSSKTVENVQLSVTVDGNVVFKKDMESVRPPEMERICVDFTKQALSENSVVECSIIQRTVQQ